MITYGKDAMDTDTFFKTLNVAIRVDADFQKLSIFSVEAHLEYGTGNSRKIADFAFTGPDEVQTFSAYDENGQSKYRYRYVVHYAGSKPAFRSEEIETDEKELTIKIGENPVPG
jgi:hypothetical protein